ncbi:NAD(P)-binding domain-containing protein [Alsobacter sp. SYSU M60028]|uniref:NAD(P)-binding domain-containing protein n=1 Tax=Alsobacter ponti TaxID=2962936 RepID=A0ABT1L812_9HYPH|nr:NAD(P)-binding domain-containing protein [Alsobacter ponti]MCP8937617.1 NAD(P)-binding domain-containing protein [Alsobacter ponti]
MTRTTDIVIIGAGQAGLAMSRCLTGAGIDHVLLERGRVAERWRARWDSLRLLTPNWMTRLPGFAYEGPDPHGFMQARDVAAMLDLYRSSFGAPVVENADVRRVTRLAGGFCVSGDAGELRARGVVVATGACDRPYVPALASALPGSILQLTTETYRSPEDTPQGGVLVVGASATGVQLADELRRAGRRVVLAVGRHTRVPRRYRGRDIMWWLDRSGILDEPRPASMSPEAARRQTSLQLVGTPENRDVGLASLAALGVRIAGRVAAVEGTRVRFGPDLREHVTRADAKLARLLARIDAFADELQGFASPCAGAHAAPDLGDGLADIDLAREEIRTVLWATGFCRDYSWLDIPVLDGDGEIVHADGVTPCPGLYVLGMPFQSRRKSTFIDGVGADAHALAARIRDSLRAARDAA